MPTREQEVDVVPLSLGSETFAGDCVVLIPKNTQLPCEHSISYYANKLPEIIATKLDEFVFFKFFACSAKFLSGRLKVTLFHLL